MSTSRVACFIDGLNLHHAIANMRGPSPYVVNLWSLASQFINHRTERLENVHYFYTPLKGQKVAHRDYVARLIDEGVTPVQGYFTTKREKCFKCKASRNVNAEKESDVNLALAILTFAIDNKYDRALVITNDGDIAPAIRQTRERFPDKHITVITPPGAGDTALELRKAASSCDQIFQEHLLNAIFSEQDFFGEEDDSWCLVS